MSTVPTYYDLEELKDILDEDNILVNEAKISAFGKESDNEINNALRYLFDDSLFPMTSTTLGQRDYDIIVGLSNQLVRGRFWHEGSGDDSILEKARAQLEQFRIRLASQPPSVTL